MFAGLNLQFGRALGPNEGNSDIIASVRNPYFSAVYQAVRHKVSSHSNFAGMVSVGHADCDLMVKTKA